MKKSLISIMLLAVVGWLVSLAFFTGCEEGKDSAQEALQGNNVDTSGSPTMYNTGSSNAAPFNVRPLRGIIPPGATLGDTNYHVGGGVHYQFYPDGGLPPYQWSVSFAELGTINSDGLYTTTGSGWIGSNTVMVTDSKGDVATATVAQP